MSMKYGAMIRGCGAEREAADRRKQKSKVRERPETLKTNWVIEIHKVSVILGVSPGVHS